MAELVACIYAFFGLRGLTYMFWITQKLFAYLINLVVHSVGKWILVCWKILQSQLSPFLVPRENIVYFFTSSIIHTNAPIYTDIKPMQYIAFPQQLAFVEITSHQNVQAVVNITRYEYNDFDLLNRIGYDVCKKCHGCLKVWSQIKHERTSFVTWNTTIM